MRLAERVFDFHDFISSWSHLLMAGFMTFVGLIMYRLTRRQPLLNAMSLMFYAGTAVALFTLSGLFHGVRHIGSDDRRFWQLLDQSAIFGLIYGSNVPLLVYFLPARRRNVLLIIMGAIAIAGSMLLWTNPKHEILALSYVGIGLLGLIPMRTYFHYLRWWGSIWVVIMAGTYTLGAICEAIHWPVIIRDGVYMFSYHEMLHMFVIAGTLAHTILLVKYVIPTADWAVERRLKEKSEIKSEPLNLKIGTHDPSSLRVM
jgi:hemolysin III